jgi:extradiol dioxygenase family protein
MKNTVEEWQALSKTAKTRELACFALGVSAGLRWAKENDDEATLVLSDPLAGAAPPCEPQRP